MTDNQLAAFFCAVPFLALSCVWIIGLSFLIPKPKPQPIRVDKKRRIY